MDDKLKDKLSAALISLALKYALPYILNKLVKDGVMKQWEANAIDNIGGLVSWVREIKTYSSSEDFPKQKSNFQDVT